MDKKQVLSSVIIKIKTQYDRVSKVVVSRKTIFGRCKDCNQRYTIVKVYCRKENLEYRIANQHVCFKCGWNVSPFQAEVDFLNRFSKIDRK